MINIMYKFFKIDPTLTLNYDYRFLMLKIVQYKLKGGVMVNGKHEIGIFRNIVVIVLLYTPSTV